MALRQLLRVVCLSVYLLISFVGVYGVPDQSRGLDINPKDSFWNSTGHKNLNASSTPSRLGTPISKGDLAPQTTPTSDSSHGNAGTVLSGRPQPIHRYTLGNNAFIATNTLSWSSGATFPPIRAGSSFSPDNFENVQATNRRNLIASRSGSASSSTYTENLGGIWPSDYRLDHAPSSRRNRSSATSWSLTTPAAGLASLSSAARSMTSGSAFNRSTNASASLGPVAAASGIRESPRLGEYLDSTKNRTGTRPRLSPYLGRRPFDIRPISLRFPWIGSYATPGLLVPIPPLARATGGSGFLSPTLNTAPSGKRVSSELRNSLPFTNKTRTNGSGGIKPYSPSNGLSLSGFNASTFNPTGHQDGLSGDRYTTNCSGLITRTRHVVYEVITSTILINETITMGPNATTPPPVLITPPSACQIVTAPCEGHYCPPPILPPIYGPIPKEPKEPVPQSTITSTLLVTKKSAAIVQQLSAVGNLFGPTPPTVAAQPNSDGQHTAGQDSGSSNPEMSTQSDDSGSPEPNADGQPPQSSTSPQIPTNGNSQSSSSNSQNSDSKEPAVGSSGSQSSGVDDQKPSNVNGLDGAASNNAATSSHGDVVSDGDASGNGETTSNGGTSNSGNGKSGGSASSNGRILNNGDTPDDEGASSSRDPSTNAEGTSVNGATSNNGKDSDNGGDPDPEAASSNRSPGIQYVSSMIMAGNLPVSVVSNAVIVGSHTVKAGSPPTIVLAKGQTVAIQPSQIIVQGKTFPIRAAVTPPPAKSATIGNLPIVLRPQDVAIGSKTFEHGVSPTSVIYNGQTYSWDDSHLVGAGTTIAFPSMDSSAPRVTAGGQVFSVFPSQLKAPGKNILIPNVATASPFIYKGQTFSVNPSQVIAPDASITLPPAQRVTSFVYIDHTVSVDASQFMARSTTIALSSGSGIVTYNGQVLTIEPSKVIGPSTTIPLSVQDDSADLPTAVTTGGLTFSIGPSAAVVGSSTYSFVPGKAPATIETHGEAVLVGSNGVQFKNVHIPIPTMTPSFSVITQGDLAFSIAPSRVVIGAHTDIISPDMIPITTVINGRTMSIGPKGVGLASTTIPLPAPKPSFSMATKGDLTFSVAPSVVVVKDKTYSVASIKAPITTNIDGQKLTIGSNGIHVEGSTVSLPAIKGPVSVTAAGLTFLVGATDAVLSGTTYAIGSGAPSQTVTVGSQIMRIGSAGVVLPSTTIAPEQALMPVTAGGLTFSMDSTKAVINATTYAIGSGAMAKSIIRGSTTIILGTDGVVLPSTTIRPWSNSAQTSSFSFVGTSNALSATTATRALTPIITGKEGDEKHVTGSSTRIFHSSTLLGFLLGTVLLGLRLI